MYELRPHNLAAVTDVQLILRDGEEIATVGIHSGNVCLQERISESEREGLKRWLRTQLASVPVINVSMVPPPPPGEDDLDDTDLFLED